MIGTITQWVNTLSAHRDQKSLYPVLSAAANLDNTQCLTSAGLAIHGAGSALVKTGSSITYAVAGGTLASIAASTDLPALVGTVTNAKFNIFCFYVDSAGARTSAMGTEGAALGNVVFPLLPTGKALIGFAIINPTGTGNFVGGTTALDDATVVPNAVYVNVTGSFDTSISI
jgi:hypothetical protein